MIKFEENIKKRLGVLNSISPRLFAEIEGVGNVIVRTVKNGGRIFTCGNGGSESSHFTCELMGRFKKSRPAIDSVCLDVNPTLLTCIGNDYGFENIFAHQISVAKFGDILFCFTTSGNSKNIEKAIAAAHKTNIDVVLVAGNDGGLLKGAADYEILIPSKETAIIQEISLAIIHYWCEVLEVSCDKI